MRSKMNRASAREAGLEWPTVKPGMGYKELRLLCGRDPINNRPQIDNLAHQAGGSSLGDPPHGRKPSGSQTHLDRRGRLPHDSTRQPSQLSVATRAWAGSKTACPTGGGDE